MEKKYLKLEGKLEFCISRFSLDFLKLSILVGYRCIPKGKPA